MLAWLRAGWLYMSIGALAACQVIGGFAEFTPPPQTDAADASSDDAAPDARSGPIPDEDAGPFPSPIARWSFDDEGRQLIDQSGNGHDLSLVSGGTVAPDAGRRGGALVFTESTQIAIATALDGPAFPRNGTLSLWIKLGSDAADTVYRNVFDAYDESRNHLFLRKSPGVAQIRVAFQPAMVSYALFEDVDYVPDQWKHIAATWDETVGGAVYADGVRIRVAEWKYPFVPEDQLFRLGNGIVGGIDDVMLFDRVLTPSQLQMVIARATSARAMSFRPAGLERPAAALRTSDGRF